MTKLRDIAMEGAAVDRFDERMAEMLKDARRVERRRLALLCVGGVAAWTAAVLSGVSDLVLTHDETHVSLGIAALAVAGTAMGFAGRWRAVKWLAEKLPAVGLLATVYGILLVSVHAAAAGDLDAVRQTILTGVGGALGPSGLGILGYAWLSACSFLCRGEDY